MYRTWSWFRLMVIIPLSGFVLCFILLIRAVAEGDYTKAIFNLLLVAVNVGSFFVIWASSGR